MIAAIDVETGTIKNQEFQPELQATPDKYILGATALQNKKTKEYTNRQQQWQDLINLGIKEQKNKRILTVYGHNIQYDLYTIMDRKDKNLTYQTSQIINLRITRITANRTII